MYTFSKRDVHVQAHVPMSIQPQEGSLALSSIRSVYDIFKLYPYVIACSLNRNDTGRVFIVPFLRRKSNILALRALYGGVIDSKCSIDVLVPDNNSKVR